MRETVTSVFRAALVVLVALSTSAAAAENEGSGYTVGKWAFKRLNEAQELLGGKKYRKALEVMEVMKRRKRINNYERAMMWQTFAHIYSAQNKLKKASSCFERCLELEALPEAAALNTQFNLGQLYLATKRYRDAVRVLGAWIDKAKNPTPQAQFMLAVAYSQVKHLRRALHMAQKAVGRVERPQESWLQLQLSLHYELKQRWEVVHVLERLIARYPRKKTYWIQLAAIYSQLKEERRLLAVLALMDRQKMLTKQSELINLAAAFQQHGVPRRAALVLERGLASGAIKRSSKTLAQLASAWTAAREIGRAIKPLRRAARLSRNGELHVRLAQLELKRERWRQAIRALRTALRRKLKNPGAAYMLLGYAHYQAGQHASALAAFKRAGSYVNTKRSARGWIEKLLNKA
jgi:tetratricopeptide (TPR) repeat protein